MELNFEGFEMQKWNISTDRAQRVDGKNKVICLVVVFTPQVIVKCQKWLIFCIFCWCQQKIRSYIALRKWYGLLNSKLPLATYQPRVSYSFIIFLLTQQFFDISTLGISQEVTLKTMKHTISWKNSKRSFRCTF